MYYLAKIFRPTASRIQSTDDQGNPRIRNSQGDKWITNLHWMILKAFEPDFLKRIVKHEVKIPSKHIKALLKGSKLAKHKLEITKNLKLIGETVAVVLKGDKYQDIVNVYYLTMLDKIQVSFNLFQEKKGKAIYAIAQGEAIAVIMPIKEPKMN